MNETVILASAAFFAGALNAVAGGGSFLTLPALVFIGVPPVIANATGTLALLPGYLSGAAAYRGPIRISNGLPMRLSLGLVLLGGASGAALLLFTPSAGFDRLVPWLLLAATLLFMAGPSLSRCLSGLGTGPRASACGLIAVSVYGGYFNGGLGILLLAFFGLMGERDLHAMNGMKNLVSMVLTGVAVAIYIWGGLILWGHALLMMVGSTLGGFVGARLAQHLPMRLLRWLVVVVGLAMTAAFFQRV